MSRKTWMGTWKFKSTHLCACYLVCTSNARVVHNSHSSHIVWYYYCALAASCRPSLGRMAGLDEDARVVVPVTPTVETLAGLHGGSRGRQLTTLGARIY